MHFLEKGGEFAGYPGTAGGREQQDGGDLHAYYQEGVGQVEESFGRFGCINPNTHRAEMAVMNGGYLTSMIRK